jgi:hypothetical protein
MKTKTLFKVQRSKPVLNEVREARALNLGTLNGN